MDDHDHKDQNGRQQVDGDGARPGGNEVAGIDDHRVGGRQGRIDRLGRLGQGQNLGRGGGERCGALFDQAQHRGDGAVLARADIGRGSVQFGQHHRIGQILGGPGDQRRRVQLAQLGDQARQFHGVLGESDGAVLDPAGLDRQAAHLRQDGVALGEGVLDRLGHGGHLILERGKLGPLLGQHAEHRAAAGKARQRAAGLLLGQVVEALADPGHVARQRLARHGIGMGAFQGRLILLNGGRHMGFHGGAPRQRGGVQPGRHGDDGHAAQRHGQQQPAACRRRADGGQQAQHIGPEDEDPHRDRDRIGQGREGGPDARIVQQRPHPQIGIDPRSRRQHAKRGRGKGIQPVQVPFQFPRIAVARAGVGGRKGVAHGLSVRKRMIARLKGRGGRPSPPAPVTVWRDRRPGARGRPPAARKPRCRRLPNVMWQPDRSRDKVDETSNWSMPS